MNDGQELIRVDHTFLALLHDGGGAISLPFEQDIFLWYTHVAGTSFVPDIASLAEPLAEGDPLQLVREPDNAFDKYAILVHTSDGRKLGYVPRAENKVFSRLLDAGKLLVGRVRSVEERHGWYDIVFDIILRD